MKALFILFDSLNRAALSCYGGRHVATPNFDRLAARGVIFDNHYVGSLPCMPARRDLLTGRLNFLHRSWGPVEPFDETFPARLGEHGVVTHLISDHYHYWEVGGAGYHNEYSSAEFVRGQERDLWKAMVEPPEARFRERYHAMASGVPRRAPNLVNREFIRDEADYPVAKCVRLAEAFLDGNHAADDWLLQVELFDPHEPFTAPARFREGLATDYRGPVLDWPLYDQLDLSPVEASELKANYLAVVAMCDHYLGRLFDALDRHALWDDTLVVLTTDHGFLLGEHRWWGKNRMPVYDAIARIPLLIADPASRTPGGTRVARLTQCLDVPATLLDAFGAEPLAHAQGHSLLARDGREPVSREHALFGLFGGAVNIADGRHVYFRYPRRGDETGLAEYTLVPAHPQSWFSAAELRDATLADGFEFTRGMPLLRIPARDDARRPPMQGGALADARTALYDLEADPDQVGPVEDAAVERRLAGAMRAVMQQAEAPRELFARFGIEPPA